MQLLAVVVGVFVCVCASVGQDPTSADVAAATTPQVAGGGSTRFFPGLEALDIFGIFSPCNRCNPRDQRTANRCCQQGQRQCCSVLSPMSFGGGFGSPMGPPMGHGMGNQFGSFGGGTGNSFGTFASDAFPPSPPPTPPFLSDANLVAITGGPAILKPGDCPMITLFSRASGPACLSECRSDSQCQGMGKCCAVGCSTICRSPAGGMKFKCLHCFHGL